MSHHDELIFPEERIFGPDPHQRDLAISSSLAPQGRGQGEGRLVETDPRRVWQVFAENSFLFRSTPTGLWLT